jgi:hypothetical protein
MPLLLLFWQSAQESSRTAILRGHPQEGSEIWRPGHVEQPGQRFFPPVGISSAPQQRESGSERLHG